MPWGAVAAAAVSAGAGLYGQSQAAGAQKSAIAPTQAAQNDLYSQAENVAATPYTPYTGAQVADITGNQQQAIQQASEAAGPQGQANQYLTQSANEAADIAGNNWNATTAQNYMNPYTQNVTDIALRQENQSYAQSENQAGVNAASQGAFGGDRAALTSAELTGQHNLNQGDIEAQGQAAAYTNAQQLWQADNNRMQQASQDYAAAGNDITQMNTSQIQNLLATGGAQQATQQMQLTANYNDYLDQRNWAANELAPLESAVGKTPVYENPAPVNYASSLIGAGSALAGYMGSNSSSSNAFAGTPYANTNSAYNAYNQNNGPTASDIANETGANSSNTGVNAPYSGGVDIGDFTPVDIAGGD